MGNKKAKKEVLIISRESIKELMVSATINPSLIAEFAHVTHVLLSALDLLDNYTCILTYHLERKVKLLSLSHGINELTPEDLNLIYRDDIREKSLNGGRIDYLDSILDKSADMMNTLEYLINVELDDIFDNHIELDDDIYYEIKEHAIGVFVNVGKVFGYQMSVNPNKIYRN